ncbi:MAG: hypothetical protein AB7Y46_00395 [Armatimonadota bacterium]
MKLMQRTICTAVVLLASVLVADAQLAGQDVTATISGLFRDADTNQYHNRTLDLVEEVTEPTGDWELVAYEDYDVEASLDDSEGDRIAEVTIRDPEG